MDAGATAQIRNMVAGIKSFDTLEQDHIDDILGWIDSSAPLFRVSKPDNPPKHLVSYFVLYDEKAKLLMLIDHIKAMSWVPTGGHVDPDENPRETVMREATEELGINAHFTQKFGANPFFVTITTTKGYGNHTDVSLWFIINGDSNAELEYDAGEMNGYQWLSPQQILDMDIIELDPHMHRFTQKLITPQ